MSEETREVFTETRLDPGWSKAGKELHTWIERVWNAGREFQRYAAQDGRTLEQTEEMSRLADMPDEAFDALLPLVKEFTDE